MLLTVETIVNSAVDLADMKNSRFIDQSDSSTSEIIRYANIAYKDLYAQIVLSKEHYFTTPYTLTIDGTTDTYNLPNNFYKLDGVDLQLNSTDYITILPFMFSERNRYRNGTVLPYTPTGRILSYMVVGNTIKFIPVPTQSNVIQVWYTPEPTTITSLLNTLSLPIGGDEYMSLYIACMMLAKEESDTTALNAKRVEVLYQMKNSLKERDLGSPAYVVDVNRLNQNIFTWT